MGMVLRREDEYVGKRVMAIEYRGKEGEEDQSGGGWIASAGLHNKLLKPLAQGASRFEKLLARKKSYWPEKITGLNLRNQRRGLHTKHD